MATAYRRKESGILVAQYKGTGREAASGAPRPRRVQDLARREAARPRVRSCCGRRVLAARGEDRQAKTATFADLIDWWDRNYAAKGRSFTEVGFLKRHTLPELGNLKVHEITAGLVEGFLVRKEALTPDGEPELKPKSIDEPRGN